MKQEIEVKFLHVSFDAVRSSLHGINAECTQPMRMMKRVVMDFPDRRLQETRDSWLRIRDEGDKVTVTYKQTTEHEFGGANEIEVTVSNYDDTIDIFRKLGMIIHTDQETMRETWKVGAVEVVLDEWPWLDPFIEIEGPTKDSVVQVAKKLGFNWKAAVFGSVTVAYREQYTAIVKDEHISKIPEIKFDLPRPDWFTKKDE
jgi:adenylate cyclase class 2